MASFLTFKVPFLLHRNYITLLCLISYLLIRHKLWLYISSAPNKFIYILSYSIPSYMFEDLNSVNGTLVNKQRIPPNQPVQLNNGDEIRLGLLVINFYTT